MSISYVTTTPMGVFTATGTGVAVAGPVNRTFQASIVGTGAVAATVIIEGSNDGAYFLVLNTITLTDTTSDSDSYVSTAAYALMRARITAISGTGATLTVTQAG